MKPPLKHLCTTIATALAATLTASAKTFDIDVSTGRPSAANGAYYHGETIEFRAVHGRTQVTNVEYGCIYYQTNGMGEAWWRTDGLVFHPTNDVGASSYRFFLEGRDDVGRDWHANGLLRLLDSPGFEPSAVQLPVKSLDFATVEVYNAPWPGEIAATGQALSDKMSDVARSATNYTDAAISAAGSVTPSMVTNIVNDVAPPPSLSPVYDEAADEYTDWMATFVPDGLTIVETPSYNGSFWLAKFSYNGSGGIQITAQETDNPAATNLTFRFLPGILEPTTFARERIRNVVGYTLGEQTDKPLVSLASYTSLVSRVSQVSQSIDYSTSNAALVSTIESTAPAPGNYAAVSNAAMSALQSFDEEDPTVPEWAKATTKPTYNASEVDAYPNESGEQLSAQVSAIGSYLNAEDARFVSTNYDSAVRMPEAFVEVRLTDNGTNVWTTIWREMTRWGRFVGNAFDWNAWDGFHAWMTNVTTELAHKADRAWGAYDSETGGWSPEGYTQISSSNILIAAGMAYQRTVTSGGAVWVLQCNQGTAHIGGDTNGFFRVVDGDGVTQFEIIKGDKRELGADADGISVSSGNVMTIPYSVEAAEHPTIQCCNNLTTASWKAENDPDCLCTVSWSGSSGAWVAAVTPKTAQPSMFVKATFMAGGETYIRNVAPVGMDSIMLNGTKYYLGTATISGHTVLTLSTTAP